MGDAVSFPSTSWSALRQVRDPGSPAHGAGLAWLAERYWRPVFCVIRWGWSRPEDEARDLTQEFFADRVLDGDLLRGFAPERGSFRSYLKGAIAHFMCDIDRAAGRLKRGGGERVLSLDGELPGLAEIAADPTAATPDEIFETAWSALVFGRALADAEARLRAEGREDWFEVFRRYDLDDQAEPLSYDELAASLGWTPRKVKRALAHARATLRDALADVVREYVDGPDDLERELRALLPP